MAGQDLRVTTRASSFARCCFLGTMLQSLGCWTGCFDSVSSGTLHARSDEDEFEAQAPDVDVYTSNASEFVNGVYSLKKFHEILLKF